SATIGGVRTRRYHALLSVATTPPTGRFVLVNGCDAHVTTDAGRFALTSQCYAPGVEHPDGARRLARFESEPWPRFTFALPDGTEIVHEIVAAHGAPMVLATWRVARRPRKARRFELAVRPMLSGRDHHALHHENGAFRFATERLGPERGAPRGSGADSPARA